uniref:Transmembrane epididymal protein 1 n=1 Tax=Sarcophilus harrisii TaxID=9305 RepID=G3VX59_SARHA
MSSFVGHLFPGLAFIFLGIYYAVLTSLALLRGQRLLFLPLPPRNKRPWGWLQQLPAEGVGKTVCGVSGLIGTFFIPLGSNRFAMIDWEDPAQPFLHHNSWQHMTMYSFLLLSGLVDMVSRCCLARQQVKLEQATWALSFHGVALLFVSHLQGKDALETRAHLLVVLPLVLAGLVLTIELWFPDQPVLWVLKAWMTLQFGSWFIQIGSFLYSPITGHPWRADKPGDVMFLTTFFCWHLIANALLIAAIYGLCVLWHQRHPPQQGAKGAGYQLCPTDSASEELKKTQRSGREGLP